jgi:hypothetical protein
MPRFERGACGGEIKEPALALSSKRVARRFHQTKMTVADEPQPQGTRGIVHCRNLDAGHFALETHGEESPPPCRTSSEGPSPPERFNEGSPHSRKTRGGTAWRSKAPHPPCFLTRSAPTSAPRRSGRQSNSTCSRAWPKDSGRPRNWPGPARPRRGASAFSRTTSRSSAFSGSTTLRAHPRKPGLPQPRLARVPRRHG